jgi:hypothetical protein
MLMNGSDIHITQPMQRYGSHYLVSICDEVEFLPQDLVVMRSVRMTKERTDVFSNPVQPVWLFDWTTHAMDRLFLDADSARRLHRSNPRLAAFWHF